MTDIQLHKEWLEPLRPEFEADYMRDLSSFLKNQKQTGVVIYPQGRHIFAALDKTPLSSVRVVILGQDPYHGPGQAHGLSFSVPRGEKVPPSLKNIYKEISQDLKLPIPNHGNLEAWAEQGVLLLNSVLTVEHSKAGSHQGKGWETFTDSIIELVNGNCSDVVFLLWGAYAQKKGAMIDQERHCILTAPHPSPLSAHRGFLGCKHFSKANEYLIKRGKAAIDWRVV